MDLHQANTERFDRLAADWDEKPGHAARAAGVAQAIRPAIALPANGRALEFGCGTGLVTLALAPQLGHVTGMDGSSGMLDVLRRKCIDRHIANVRTLLGNVPADLPDERFDLITSTLTLHHVADTASLLRVLFEHLTPGGYVALADLDAENGTFHEDDTGVAHHGFVRADVERMLRTAGYADIRLSTAWTVHKLGSDGIERDYPIFLAVAQRPRGRT